MIYGKLLARVGEATNPGPSHARWCGAEGARYRDPSATGFWGARAPGHSCDGEVGEDTFALRIVTTNSTSWGPLKAFLCRTDADVVLAQEHHIPPCHIAEASDWAMRHRWQSIFLPAQLTQEGGWSAGVAILARPHAALSAPRVGSETVVPHRVLAACIEPPGHRQILILSIYLKDGAGLSAQNLGYLAAAGTCINMHGPNHPFLVGGDFQLDPQDMARAGFGEHVGATLITSAAARGTCRSTRSFSEIDYFYIQNSLALGVKSISTVEGAGTRPHVPVAVDFHPRITSTRALFLRLPPPLPSERVFGPIQREPDWTEVKKLTRDIDMEAKEGIIDAGFRRSSEPQDTSSPSRRGSAAGTPSSYGDPSCPRNRGRQLTTQLPHGGRLQVSARIS